MAQSEDTELRDLVMEALEKNGSLAKIRALLRANVFLAFEDEREKVKNNISLDNILKVPEGVLTMSLIHEFLEFCSLKNTLFVYMAETRQGRDYSYEGQKILSDKFRELKRDQVKEPLLVTIVKHISKILIPSINDTNANTNLSKDDQNCTYIVHEDSCSHSSSSQCNSHSDQSSDEKKKLHLRLPLDNSDTDTSSDSMRDKTHSEYIPNKHILINDDSEDDTKDIITQHVDSTSHTKGFHKRQSDTQDQKSELEFAMNNSSQSTSYVEITPFINHAEKLIKSHGSLESSKIDKENGKDHFTPSQNLKSPILDSNSSTTISDVTSLSSKNIGQNYQVKKKENDNNKICNNTPEYSFDFSPSPTSKNLEIESGPTQDHTVKSLLDSPRQTSQSSQSSVSISDVADLIDISGTNSPMIQKSENGCGLHEANDVLKKANWKDNDKHKSQSDDSVNFSGSPIPSLSNLSLDFHSD